MTGYDSCYGTRLRVWTRAAHTRAGCQLCAAPLRWHIPIRVRAPHSCVKQGLSVFYLYTRRRRKADSRAANREKNVVFRTAEARAFG